jgi:hypothetical protein
MLEAIRDGTPRDILMIVVHSSSGNTPHRRRDVAFVTLVAQARVLHFGINQGVSMYRILLSAFLTFGLLLIGLQASHAQATRTWVSGVGDDANPCSRTAPCKTFAGAISKTAAKGEINVLDPGGFGGVTITKSISIIAENVQAGVLVSGTNGIIINAGVNDVVELVGLNIDGVGTGLAGVKVLSAKAVHIRRSSVRGFANVSSGVGIHVVPSVNPAKVTVSDTVVTQNAQGILDAPGGAGSASTVTVDRVVVENNAGPGIRATANGTIRVSNSVITGNNRGVLSAGTGQVISLGNNLLAGNIIDGTFDATIPLQ